MATQERQKAGGRRQKLKPVEFEATFRPPFDQTAVPDNAKMLAICYIRRSGQSGDRWQQSGWLRKRAAYWGLPVNSE
jgi:hypothetical protein